MQDIVVVGAGIAGIPAAYELTRRLGFNARITVVSDREYFHFVPSNPALAVGWRVESDIALPIKPYIESRGISRRAPITIRTEDDREGKECRSR